MVVASVGNTGNYYQCLTSGISGSSAPAWPSVFGVTVVDGTVGWVLSQRKRNAWQASSLYTTGLPLQTTGTLASGGASITSIAGGAKFIPQGAYIVGASVPSGAVVNAVTAASTAVMSVNATGTGTVTLEFNQLQYPQDDQIVTNASVGSAVMQCIVTGTSGSVQPVWPSTANLQATNGIYSFVVVNDTAPLQWTAVGYDPGGSASVWTASHTYTAGQVVYANVWDWVCTVGGTTGAASTQPVWPIVRDGSALWAMVGTN